jgi:N-methylhydantoinase A/oxoprolinase/acetone carboxylase beta subunit
VAYLIAIDIGGTFTDLVACNVETGAVAYTKSPTTYGHLDEAIFDCICKARLDAREATSVKHGTTLVINALLQRSGAKTALLTTRGFRDVLEIGRGNRTQPFNLRFHRDPPLVPRELRLEVTERVDGAGSQRCEMIVSTLTPKPSSAWIPGSSGPNSTATLGPFASWRLPSRMTYFRNAPTPATLGVSSELPSGT